MSQPLKGPFIEAKGYRKGRALREGRRVAWLALHTAEGAKDEIALGHFFAGTKKGSSNGGAGQLGGYATYVKYADTPWTNPPLNEESDTLEICGFARWTRAEWLAHPKMLDTVARWIAWRATVRGIPIEYLPRPTPDTSGVTGHVDINRVYRQSSHTDPGPRFPWDVVIASARQYAGLDLQEEDMAISQDDVERIAAAVWARAFKDYVPEAKGKLITASDALFKARADAHEAAKK